MRLLITLLQTVIVIMFAIQNFDHVPVYFIYGKPVQIRLIFIIASAFILGYFLHFLLGLNREEAIKKKYRLMMRQQKNRGQNINDIFHEDV